VAAGFEVASAFVTLRADGAGLGKDVKASINKAGDGADKAGSAIGKKLVAGIGLAVAAGGALIGAGLFSSVNMAAEFEQSFGAIDAVFKENSKQVHAWASDAAQTVGLSANDYNVFATQIGAQLKGAGVPMDELGNKTNDLVTKGADLASMFGGSTADAVSALGAGMRGEFDSLEQYGIAIKQSDINARLAADGQGDLTGQALKNASATAYLALLQEQTADSTGNFARESETLSGSLQRTRAGLTDMATGIGTTLLPGVSALAAAFAAEAMPALQDLVSLFDEKASPAIAAFADWIGTVDFGALLSGAADMSPVMALLEAFAPIFPIIGDAILTLAPIVGEIVQLLGGALAEAVLLLLPSFMELLPTITELAGSLGGSLVAALTAVSPILTIVADVLSGLMSFLASNPGLMEALVIGIVAWTGAQWLLNAAMLANPVGLIIAGIVLLIAGIVLLVKHWDKIVSFITEIWGGFIAWISGVIAGFVARWNATWVAVGAIISAAWKGLVTGVKTLWTTFTSWIMAKLLAYVSFWAGVWNGIKATISTVWNGIVSFVKMAIGNIVNNIKSSIQGMQATWNSIWSNVGGTVSRIVSNVKGFISGMLSTITEIPGRIKNALSNAGSWLLNVGKNVIDGLITGIRNNVGKIASALMGGVKNAINTVKNFLGINSPSRLFRDQIGAMIPAGMEVGIEGGEKSLNSTIAHMVEMPKAPQFVGSTPGATSGIGAISSSTVIQHNIITIDAKNVKDFNSVVDIMANIEQTARTGAGTPERG